MFIISLQAIILLSLVMVVSVEANNHDVCDDESAAKLSKIFGLNIHHLIKEQKIEELETDARKLQSFISYTQLEKQHLEIEINNTKTQDLEHLEASQSCDRKIATDCCQVGIHKIKYDFSSSYPPFKLTDKNVVSFSTVWAICNQRSMCR